MAGIDEQGSSRDRGHAMAGVDAVDAPPSLPIPTILFEPRQSLQPKHIRAVEGQGMHALGTQGRDVLETRRTPIQSDDAVAAGHPGLSRGRHHHRVDVGGTQPTGIAGGDLKQDLACGGVALLDAASRSREPQRAIHGQ